MSQLARKGMLYTTELQTYLLELALEGQILTFRTDEVLAKVEAFFTLGPQRSGFRKN